MSNKIHDFVVSYVEKNGRKPKVLHIGNIANNAYINAKLLNDLGFDCDVICPNYYHIMGTPEWEDARIEDEIKDHFRPDWKTIKLSGFKRPTWFVQGPLGLSIKYLRARNAKKTESAKRYWTMLQDVNNTDSSSETLGLQYSTFVFFWNCYKFLERIVRNLAVNPKAVLRKIDEILNIEQIYKRIFFSNITRWSQQTNKNKKIRLFCLIKINYVLSLLANALHNLFLLIVYGIISLKNKDISYRDIVKRLKKDHEKVFLLRSDKINFVSLLPYINDLQSWKTLFKDYDIIQGYAIDPIYPYLANEPYFAFEHGTLRSLPFDGTVNGTLTALAFANAKHVFVTNSDCVKNARRLSGERFTVIPHPYDERRINKIQPSDALKNGLLKKTSSEFLIFYPTRHDWVEGKGFADKANDRFLRAFARLRKNGISAGLVCCSWGNNVLQSKALLNQLGCEDYVLWFEPMCETRYEEMSVASDVIADQFLLGAFGGITFRGLAAGRPVCTRLDEDEVLQAYGSIPPVINCQTEHDILKSLIKLFEDSEYRDNVGEKSAGWIRKYHSGMQTARVQARLYIDFLTSDTIENSKHKSENGKARDRR